MARDETAKNPRNTANPIPSIPPPDPAESVPLQPVAKRLDRLTEPEKDQIIEAIENGWSNVRIAKTIALPPPNGLLIKTTHHSVARFRGAHNARLAAERARLLQQTVNEVHQLTAAGDLTEATIQLLKARLYEASSDPEHDNKDLPNLIRATKLLRDLAGSPTPNPLG